MCFLARSQQVCSSSARRRYGGGVVVLCGDELWRGTSRVCCVSEPLCSRLVRMLGVCCVSEQLCSRFVRVLAVCCVSEPLCSRLVRVFRVCCVSEPLCSRLVRIECASRTARDCCAFIDVSGFGESGGRSFTVLVGWKLLRGESLKAELRAFNLCRRCELIIPESE